MATAFATVPAAATTTAATTTTTTTVATAETSCNDGYFYVGR